MERIENNNSFNLFQLYYEFLISQPFLSSLSFIFIIFYGLLVVYYPKYYGKLLSIIPNNNKEELYRNIYKLIILYSLLWIGTLIHLSIVQTYLLKKSRTFFFRKIFYPIWNKVENGNIKENISSKLIKNIFLLISDCSNILKLVIFSILPFVFSIGLFLYYLPNILYVKILIITTFIIVTFILYKSSKIVKEKSLIRIAQTKKNLEIIEDIINNKLTIMNFNSRNKEFDIFEKNCNLQEKKCFMNGLCHITLSILCVIVLLIGLLTPIFLLKQKLDLQSYKTFLITYIPMISTIIILFYTSLNRFISFFQVIGEQENAVNDINKYLFKNKKYNNNQDNRYTPNLKLNNISLKFNNNVIFNNLHIEFKKGITLIKGHIGTGKSCILHMIFGILNYQQGDIHYKHNHKNSMNIQEWRENMVFINQFPSFFETKNINQNIYYNKEDKQKINGLLIELNIQKKFNYLLENNIQSHQLSGGEKQIIYFIRSIVNDKKEIYLIDEPTSSLDIKMKNIIYDIMIKLKKKNKIIIVVSHDIYFEKIADNIIDINIIRK